MKKTFCIHITLGFLYYKIEQIANSVTAPLVILRYYMQNGLQFLLLDAEEVMFL